MDVSGNVSLTLYELDKLRDSIVTKDEQLQKKNHRISELAVEIAKIKSEQPKVTVTIKQLTDYIELQRVSEPHDPYKYYGGDPYRYEQNRASLYGKFPDSISQPQVKPVPKYNEVKKQHVGTSIEYLNLEDVKDELRKDVETRYGDELISLRNKVTSLTKERIDYEASAYKEQQQLISGFNKQIEEQELRQVKEVDHLHNVIKELREEEVQKTKDQLIVDLKAELAKLKNRGLMERIFN